LSLHKPGDLISRTQAMYRDVLGEEPRIVSDFAPAFQALVDGVTEIIVELPWDETQGGVRVERHQIVLRRLDDDNARVIYYNPAARRDVEVGQSIGGKSGEGPFRRAETAGLESMPLTEIARTFAEGTAIALIPPADF
jgi:hypothetical protein